MTAENIVYFMLGGLLTSLGFLIAKRSRRFRHYWRKGGLWY